jgi:hypothetical protein
MEGFMSFAGISYAAVAIAAVLAFVFGSVYYGVLSKPWQRAGRIDPVNARPGPALLAVTLVCEVVAAFVLAAFMQGLGQTGIGGGLTVAFFAWLGFVVSSMAMNHRYQGFGWDLTIIDGGHWLGALLIMGAVIGWWG